MAGMLLCLFGGGVKVDKKTLKTQTDLFDDFFDEVSPPGEMCGACWLQYGDPWQRMPAKENEKKTKRKTNRN